VNLYGITPAYTSIDIGTSIVAITRCHLQISGEEGFVNAINVLQESIVHRHLLDRVWSGYSTEYD